MEFDFNQVVENVRRGMSGDSAVFVGEAVKLGRPAVHAVKVSFAITPVGIGVDITVDKGAMQAVKKVLPDGDYDEWCAETVAQIGKSVWFKERCAKLNAIMCKADIEYEKRGDLNGSV